jgi:hypothetical protein
VTVSWVSTPPGTAGPPTKAATCTYTGSALRAGVDGLLGDIHWIADVDKRSYMPLVGALFSAFGTCGHVNEARLIQLTNEVLGAARDALAAQEAAAHLAYLTGGHQVNLQAVTASGAPAGPPVHLGPVGTAGHGRLRLAGALLSSADHRWLVWGEEDGVRTPVGHPDDAFGLEQVDAVRTRWKDTTTGASGTPPDVLPTAFAGDRLVVQDRDSRTFHLVTFDQAPPSLTPVTGENFRLGAFSGGSVGLDVVPAAPGSDPSTIAEQIRILPLTGEAPHVLATITASLSSTSAWQVATVDPAGHQVALEHGDHTDFCGVGPSSTLALYDLVTGARTEAPAVGAPQAQWRFASGTFAGGVLAAATFYRCTPDGHILAGAYRWGSGRWSVLDPAGIEVAAGPGGLLAVARGSWVFDTTYDWGAGVTRAGAPVRVLGPSGWQDLTDGATELAWTG